MFDLLLSPNIKQYKNNLESGLVSYGNVGRFFVQAPTRCLAMVRDPTLLQGF